MLHKNKKQLYMLGIFIVGLIFIISTTGLAMTVANHSELLTELYSDMSTTAKTLITILTGVTLLAYLVFGKSFSILGSKEVSYTKNEIRGLVKDKLEDVVISNNADHTKIKQELTSRFKDLTKLISNNHAALEKSLNYIGERVDTLESGLQEASLSLSLFKDRADVMFIINKRMVNQAKSKIVMMPDELIPFADYKAKRFIDLVIEIVEIGFYKKRAIKEGKETATNISSILTINNFKIKVTARAEEIRKKGIIMLGDKFIAKFYENHLKDTDEYINNTLATITDPGNFKEKHFIEDSEKFQERFLTVLSDTYKKCKDLIDSEIA